MYLPVLSSEGGLALYLQEIKKFPILTADEENEGSKKILASVLGSDGRQTDILHVPGGGSACPITPDNADQKLNANNDMIKSRAKAREVTTDQYMKGNLLLNEVRAEDVAKAFFHLAVSKKTTGAVLTVDGGNIAASLR